jgi:hypothetical protein
MSDGSSSRRVRSGVASGPTWAGAVAVCVGIVLGLCTVLVSATNMISAQQAIAMALPAIVGIIGGLVRSLVFDSWTAWRRGFEQGCQTALAYGRPNSSANDPGVSDLNGATTPVRLAPPLPRPRSPGHTGLLPGTATRVRSARRRPARRRRRRLA